MTGSFYLKKNSIVSSLPFFFKKVFIWFTFFDDLAASEMVFFSRMRLCDCDVGAIVPNFYFRDRSILQDSLSLSLSLSLSRGVLSR